MGVIRTLAWNDASDRLIAIAYEHLFALPNMPDVRAKASFEFADIYRLHRRIIADVTKLVTLPETMHGLVAPSGNFHCFRE
jgi:hypothetical protein